MKGARSFPQFGLRMPQELKDWLAHRAVDNHRSLNNEIIDRLEHSRRQEEEKKESSHG